MKQLSKEVEVKRELVAQLREKNDMECKENNILAQEKLLNNETIDRLIRDQQSKGQQVDHLQIELEEGKANEAALQFKMSAAKDVASKLEKIKACCVLLSGNFVFHSVYSI